MKKVLFGISVCLALVCAINGQTAEAGNTDSPVSKVTLAKAGPDGNIVEDPEKFFSKDIPIYCYVDLKEDKPSLIMVKYIAVKAVSIRPNHVIVTLKYQTKKGEIGAAFDAIPGKPWATGDYRVDVYVDGKLVENREFVISAN